MTSVLLGSIFIDMADTEKRLDRIGVCLACGVNIHQAPLNRDHYFPQAMLTLPPGIDRSKHPFRRLVLDRANIFRLCVPDHIEIDRKKMEAYGGPRLADIDPLALVQCLREYPITKNPRYRLLQLLSLLETQSRFIEVVANLNGELPKSLVNRYKEAADESKELIVGQIVPDLQTIDFRLKKH